jgi:hypothetical protein
MNGGKQPCPPPERVGRLSLLFMPLGVAHGNRNLNSECLDDLQGFPVEPARFPGMQVDQSHGMLFDYHRNED